ncbi:MAG: DUF3592 domain-containing protein [Chloroflexi bacterium]|nr:DUF3592 domain-containing protein [Chloroflexota bacterium]
MSLDAIDVLRSLRLLRSHDAEDRKRGITLLSSSLDDPRVAQVFEYLHQHDPDPGVRALAWQALNPHGPAIPAPGPPLALPPEPTGPQPTPVPPIERADPPPAAPFLMNPAHARWIARQRSSSGRWRRMVLWLTGLLLLVAGVLWGLVLPDWVTWYRLRQDGMTVNGTLSDLQDGGDSYFARYHFYTSDSADLPFPGEQRVDREAFETLVEGDPVEVTYLPDNPDVSRLAWENPEDARRDRQTIVAGGTTGAVLLLLLTNRFQRGSRRLLRGEIVSCEGHTDQRQRVNVRLQCRFRTPFGQVHTVQASQVRADLTLDTLPAAGTPVIVEYHHDRAFRVL